MADSRFLRMRSRRRSSSLRCGFAALRPPFPFRLVDDAGLAGAGAGGGAGAWVGSVLTGATLGDGDDGGGEAGVGSVMTKVVPRATCGWSGECVRGVRLWGGGKRCREEL